MNIELFSCAGGMAEGFRRAGIEFDFAFDFAKDHCDSYQANIGHRPVCMDVRDLLRLASASLLSGPVELLVGDPPCTPWSRAGLRKGTNDERDMIEETCELIKILRPKAYLIGNVPGLDDSKNWHVVQRVIGGLHAHGYCVADFAALDAADYGVPQHRERPFWFGHLQGPCIRWPAPTHGDRSSVGVTNLTLPGTGVDPLIPWVTCRQALGHLPPKELGRPVKLRRRSQNSKQHGSVADKPARVVGTSNLSDGNVLLVNDKHPPMQYDLPATAITAKQRSQGGQTLATGRARSSRQRSTHEGGYTPTSIDEPAKSIVRNTHGNGTVVVSSKHPALTPDAPSTTIRGGGDNGHSAPTLVYDVHPPHDIDKPANVIRAGDGQGGNRAMRVDAVTVTSKHPAHDIDKPANTVRASDGGGSKSAMRTRDVGRVGQGNRIGEPDEPGRTVTGKASRVGAGAAHVLKWPWDRPSTVVQSDNRIAPPGHRDENWDGGTRSLEGAVVLSERAAAILQGFPETWKFCGRTKKIRWSQIGQAMPPALAHAVATAVAQQRAATLASRTSASPSRKRTGGDDPDLPVASNPCSNTRKEI